MQTAGQRLRHRALFKRQPAGQLEALRRRGDVLLSKSAVLRDAERLQMCAELLFSVAAGSTRAAVHVGIDRNMVAGYKTLHTRAHFLHDTGVFMPQHHGRRHVRRTGLAVIDVHIRAAYTARHHAQTHLIFSQCANCLCDTKR